jgi:hypothetical protein
MMPAETNYASTCRWLRALSLIALAIGVASFQAEAGEILTRVQARQVLRCGVSDGRLVFRSGTPRVAGQDWTWISVAQSQRRR